MTTSTSVTTAKPLEITDLSLLAFHQMHQETFEAVNSEYRGFYPAAQALEKKAEELNVQLRNRTFELQRQHAPIPAQVEIKSEEQGYLCRYADLFDNCKRIKLVAEAIKDISQTLSQKQYHFVDKSRIEQDQPELLPQLNVLENYCRDQVKGLNDRYRYLNELKEKLMDKLSSEVAWPLQRFSHIVLNEGSPVSQATRGWEHFTAAVRTIPIPRPENSTVSSNQLLDSPLITCESIHTNVYDKLKVAFANFYPNTQNLEKSLDTLKATVNKRHDVLQERRGENPGLQVLQEERQAYVRFFWEDFVPEYQKSCVFAEQMQRSIILLKPTISQDEKAAFQKEQPALFAKLEQEEKRCQEYTTELNAKLAQLVELNQKINTLMTGETAFALQRFCWLVDNGGKPLSTWNWLTGKIVETTVTPVVPKPQPIVTLPVPVQESGQEDAAENKAGSLAIPPAPAPTSDQVAQAT